MIDLRSDLMSFIAEALPLIANTVNAAPTVLDVALPSIQFATAADDWGTVARSGAALIAAIGALRTRYEGIDPTFEREIGRLTGAYIDQVLYAVARLPEASHLGALCDMLLDGGFAGRQYVQTADPAVRRAWDFGTGIIANGGGLLSDDEYAAKVAAGAWLSERQHAKVDPLDVQTLMTDWMMQSEQVLAGVPSLGLLAKNGDAHAAWDAVLDALDRTYALDRAWWLMFSAAAGCVTPLAAHQTGRDIVYVVCGSAGGAAVRYFGGVRYREMPDVLLLPRAGLVEARAIDAAFESARDVPAAEMIERTARLDAARLALGDQFVAPIIARWPEIDRVTLIPLGEAQRLPFSAALVDGNRFNALADVSIAPNAASIFVAGAGGVCSADSDVVIMADPADGDLHLPWVSVEARDVAAAYGRLPDLLVEYTSPVRAGQNERSLMDTPPVLNVTSEHILTRLENAKVVHLACHGDVPVADGLPTLFLHGALTFDALEHHRFADGATVVLSACSVGGAIRSAPYAQLGFPSMLLATGASEVVASSAPLIDCPQTVQFMVSLHEQLRTGIAASRALSNAMAHAEAAGIGSAVWANLQVHGARVGQSRTSRSEQFGMAG